MKYRPENLVALVKGGDRRAFDHFYGMEYKKAFFYSLNYVHNREIAEDIVQDAFASLWVNRDSLDPIYPLQPYLYSILRNRSINLLKRLALDQKIMSEISKREHRANLAALNDDSADTLVRSQLEEFINKAYLELPLKISSSFADSRIRGMTYQEIADKKGVSVKVIEYHITQALKHFKIKLKDFLE